VDLLPLLKEQNILLIVGLNIFLVCDVFKTSIDDNIHMEKLAYLKVIHNICYGSVMDFLLM
jgi:hypothetical protein